MKEPLDDPQGPANEGAEPAPADRADGGLRRRLGQKLRARRRRWFGRDEAQSLAFYGEFYRPRLDRDEGTADA